MAARRRRETASEAARPSWSCPTLWPPADADAVPVTDAYERLAALGYGYGPTFQTLRAMWRRGPEDLR